MKVRQWVERIIVAAIVLCLVAFFYRADDFLRKADFYKNNMVLTGVFIAALLFGVLALAVELRDRKADKEKMERMQKELQRFYEERNAKKRGEIHDQED